MKTNRNKWQLRQHMCRTNIPDFNPRKRSELFIPQLQHEDMDAMLHPIDDHLRVDDAVCRHHKVRGPPFHRSQRGSREHQLFSCLVVRSRGLEATYIRPVPELFTART